MTVESMQEEVSELREIFGHLMHSAVANAAVLTVLEEVCRAFLGSLPPIDREAIRARVSERVPGAGMAEPILEAIDRLFGQQAPPPARH